MNNLMRAGLASAICGLVFCFGQNGFADEVISPQSPIDVKLNSGTIVQRSGFQLLDAKVKDTNPFGVGTSVSGHAEALTNLGSNFERDVLAQVEYEEHRFFGQGAPFFSLGIVYFDRAASGISELGNYHSHDQYLSPFVAVTQPFGQNSYVGIQFRRPFLDHSNSDFNSSVDYFSGGTNTRDQHDFQYILSYGWNSLNDSNFPTQGSQLRFTVPMTPGSQATVHTQLGFRKVWSLNERSIWDFALGSTDEFDEYRLRGVSELPIDAFVAGFGYAYDLKRNQDSDTVRSARLGLDLGFKDGTSTHFAPGARLGLKMDVAGVGMINLFLMYQKE